VRTEASVLEYLKSKLSIPAVKYSAVTVSSGLWGYGLIGQIHSLSAAMTYVLLSLLIVAIALLKGTGA
jgi:hypothetical protein